MVVGTFQERIEELRKLVGSGERLVGTVTVDQLYAHYQLIGTSVPICVTRVVVGRSTC
jgi:hypothetical protein